MRVAVLLAAALLLGCGRKSSSSRVPQAVDGGGTMTGGQNGSASGGPDALGAGRVDAASGRGPEEDGGRADRVFVPDTQTPSFSPDALPGDVARVPDGGGLAGSDAVAAVDRQPDRPLPPPPVTPDFHLTLPLSSSIITSRYPTFGWVDPGGVEYFIIELCRDQLCADVFERGYSGLTAFTLNRLLDEGVVFWRVRAMLPDGRGVIDTPVWEAFVPAQTTRRDTSMLAFPDFNRDGFADVAQASAGGEVVVTLFTAGGVPKRAPIVLPGPARALAYAIDVNADGYGDLLVARDQSVDVYHGFPDGLTLVSALTGGAGFGAGVAGVGDVNGDGLGDVMVGSQTGANAGTAALFLSSKLGLRAPSGTPLPMGRFGPAADVNADGFADVVACSPVTGRALLYVGSPQGLTFMGALEDPRSTGSASFGNACQGVGDVNGDGFGDVIVTGANMDQGLVAVLYLGAETALPTAKATLNVAGRSADELYVASAGDVNHDGLTDVLLTTDSGVRLYLGASGGLATPPARVIEGDYRTAVGIGDVDDNNSSDVLLAPRGCDQPVKIYGGEGVGLTAAPLHTFPTSGPPLCPNHLLAR